jgi:hypothetical protein
MGSKSITVGGKTVELTELQHEKLLEILDKEVARYEEFEDIIGTDVFIRGVTMYYTGHVEGITNGFIKLKDAAWIASTGRFADFMKGKPDGNQEVEPMGNTMVSISSILDISPLQMSLPLEQK